MQTFLYTGVNQRGQRIKGRLITRDETSLEDRVREMGLWLVEAQVDEGKDTRKGRRRAPIFGSGNRRELIDFATLMSVQLKAGVAMLVALETAAGDCKNKRFKSAVAEIRKLIEGGESLHEAMRRFPDAFPPYFSSLVRAGEDSGTLPETFLELKRYLEWQESIISDVRQATIYPAIVFCCVVVFVLGLFSYVVPQFAKLLKTAGAELPPLTRVVFAIGDVVNKTWWVWVILVVVLPIVLQILRARIHKVAVWVDRLKFEVPLFGELNRMLVMARFAHNLSMLYRSGIVIVNAIRLCEELLRSALMSDVLADVRQRVVAGEPVSEAMRKHLVFPSLVIRMVAMGERTGSLDAALDNVADYYNTVIPRRIKKVFSVAEPMLILVLVAVVGCVALAVFLPIMSLMQAAGKSR
ncbi:MAG: type II secretion system F family protein [Verrucomicrobiales bacterium]|nr:type II secretion system F family protein [Verrucomicrobiales bacterium]